MRCDRQVLALVWIPSVFAAPIGQSFFRPAQLRHKHETETETETTTETHTEIETQMETVYVTDIYTQVNEVIPESLPTSSTIESTSTDQEPKETKSLAPIALPDPPEEEFSSDNGKFLGLFLAVIGIVALLATVFFMLHRYRALHKRTTSRNFLTSSSSSSSNKAMSKSSNEYVGGEELDRKQTSITLLNGDSDGRTNARIAGTPEGSQQTRAEKLSWLGGQHPVALVGNERIPESPRPLSMIELPPFVLKRESSPSPLRNMLWQARHSSVIKSPRIPVTQSMSDIGDQERYDVQCRRCEKLWLARPLSREWPKSP